MRFLLVLCCLSFAGLLTACGSGGGGSASAGSGAGANSSTSSSSTSNSTSSSSSSSAGSSSSSGFYASRIETPIVQSRCVTCHVDQGVSGHTRLVFTSGASAAAVNESIFTNFVTTISNGQSLLLDKTRGGASHGGGAIFAASSTEYQDLSTYLSGVTGVDVGGTTPSTQFDGVQLESYQSTLRRAALIFAGRLPTEEERLLATSEAALGPIIKSMMTGKAFHDYLIRGANDRLLTDAFLNDRFLGVVDSNAAFYPNLADRRYAAYSEGGEAMARFEQWENRLRYGVARAPLELIAHVVENDLPYTDILTANYTMVNPQSAVVYNANVTFESEDPTQFAVGLNRGQILLDPFLQAEFSQVLGLNIFAHGEFVNYPHAGILNEPAFLNRYPTTDTNRNRARARWTYYHFLDVDIEKSAARTTDPVALADRDNPTMNNPNCTVCHQLMDPVAGAFQNYGDVGWYKDSEGGLDALPATYKWADGSPYQQGDTWFRDMRAPGLGDQIISDSASSLQWLGAQITNTDAFAVATVKFWWASVMSEALVDLPEHAADPFYEQKLQLYETQQSVIQDLATQFRTGFDGGAPYQLKDLLVGLVMTDWFRASTSVEAASELRTEKLQAIGKGRLLTPAELENKTQAIVGFAWGGGPADWDIEGYWSYLNDRYRIYYGGIDANGIVERAKAMNSLMANVAEAQALSVACPAVVFDFNRAAEERRIFSELDRYITPLLQARSSQLVSGTSDSASSQHSLVATLDEGQQRLRLLLENPFWDETAQLSTLLAIHRVRLVNAAGQLLLDINGEDLPTYPGVSSSATEAGDFEGSVYWDAAAGTQVGWLLWQGYVELPINVAAAGEYTVLVDASRLNLPERPVQLGIVINASSTDISTVGRDRILAQLQQLHRQFLGEELALADPELQASYALLQELWQARQTAGYPRSAVAWDQETCEIPIEGWWSVDRSAELADPDHMQGTWISMLIYFMTDFRYLHE